MKGAPALHGVCTNLQKLVAGYGNETAKYPLEVLYEWEGTGPGATLGLQNAQEGAADLAIQPFSLCSSVCVASQLFCWGVIQLGTLNKLASTDGVGQALACRLLKCLRLLAFS